MERSDEQFAHLPSGIEICFDTVGNPADPPILLIMGLSGPMIWWSDEFCEQLAERGFYVIRFDNRDIGRSSKMDGAPTRRIDTIQALVRGTRGRPPYTLSDLADDAVGVLDHLSIERATVVGVSMGGMIAQTLALEHPTRVLALVSIMSTTGNRLVGWQHPRLVPLLLRSRAVDRDAYLRQWMAVSRLIGSPGYLVSDEEEEAMAMATFDRGLSPDGVARQLQAIVAQPDRTSRLGTLAVPTLVIHGLADRMVHVSGGRATAAAIPGAELLLVPGMGHDLPKALWPDIHDGIERTARKGALT